MSETKVFNITIQGESHKATNKVCQDYSKTYTQLENGVHLSVVSDGHGGNTYFRSDVGSRLVTEITIEALVDFIKNTPKEALMCPFTAIEANSTEVKKGVCRKMTLQDEIFRRLFSYIIMQWNEEIFKDWTEHPISAEELAAMNVPEKAALAFQRNEQLEKAYGCTLIAYAQTPDYWIAFQLGDGKCIAYLADGTWSEPIPWDEQCFLNQTTSMCDRKALDNFRYCYGNTRQPIAVFIGSDGMDDSFSSIEDLSNFYILMLKMFAKEGYEQSVDEIKAYLPKLSHQGSRDDMSVAGVLNMEEVRKLIPILLQRQLEKTEYSVKEAEEALHAAKQAVSNCLQNIGQNQEEQNLYHQKLNQELSTIEHAQVEEKQTESEIFKAKNIFRNFEQLLETVQKKIINATLNRKHIEEELQNKQHQLKKIEADYKMAQLEYERKLKEKEEALQLLVSVQTEIEETSKEPE